MTVPTSDNREEYTGNDATTSFDYAFKIFEDSDLQVYLQAADGTETLLVLNTDYSVSGAGDLAGGSVTYPLSGDPLASDEKLIILRVLDVVQETDLRNQGAYYPQVVEDEFDRSRMIDQQQQEEIDRALKRPAAEDGYDADGRQIKNGAAATDGSDVVIKSQVDNRFANDVITKTAGRWDGKGLRATNFQTAPIPLADELVNASYLQAYVGDILSGGGGVAPTTYLYDGDGSTVDFSVPGITVADPSVYSVTVDGVDQRPTTDYTVDIENELISFVEAPPAPYPGETSNVMIRILGFQKSIVEMGRPIRDVSTMISTNLSEGTFVKTAGYYSPGDGGANDYEIVAGATGTADGGSFIDLDNGLQAKSLANPGTVNVKQWGARADGVTDDSARFNAAADYARTQWFRWENEPTGTTFNQANAFLFLIPAGQYRINSPINFTGINRSHSWWYVGAKGAVIFGDCPSKTVFDLVDSRKCAWFGGTIICDDDLSVTRSGIQLGRAGGSAAGRPADSHHFIDVEVKGYFTLGSIYNYASEDTFFEHVALKNDYDDPDAYCIVQDGTHYWGIASDFVTAQPLNTAASFLRNTFLRFDARKTNGGGPVWYCSQATNHEMITSYLVGYSTQAIKVFYNLKNSFDGFVCDIHLETDLGDADPLTGLQRAFTFDAASPGTAAAVTGLRFRDNYPHCQDAFFVPEANIDTLDILSADVDLGTASRLNEAVIFGVAPKIGFSGKLRYDSADANVPNYENTFNSLRYFHGSIEVRNSETRGKVNQLKGNPVVIDRTGVYQKNGQGFLPGSTNRFRQSFLRTNKSESSFIEANVSTGVDTLTVGTNSTDIARFSNANAAFYPASDSNFNLGLPTLRWSIVYSDIIDLESRSSAPPTANVGHIAVDDGTNWSGANATGSPRPVFYDGSTWIAMF